jgi:hypothetical protein
VLLDGLDEAAGRRDAIALMLTRLVRMGIAAVATCRPDGARPATELGTRVYPLYPQRCSAHTFRVRSSVRAGWVLDAKLAHSQHECVRLELQPLTHEQAGDAYMAQVRFCPERS